MAEMAKIPGLMSSHYAQLQKKNYRKRHAMAQIMAGTEEIVPAISVPDSKSGNEIEIKTKNEERNERNGTSTKYITTSTLPKWITNDRLVLRFYAYFYENSPKDEEFTQLRKIVVHYYLADGSIEVSEPRIHNSGLAQGMFLRRTVLKTIENCPYTPQDFKIGKSIQIKGRACKFVDCDAATREYYTQNNQPQPPALPYPDTPQVSQWHEIERIKTAGTSQAQHRELAKSKAAKVKQFMEYSNNVLRFYCLWDDPHPLYPETRTFILHYYLADDTIDVREATRRDLGSTGRYKHPVLVSRRRLAYESTNSVPAANTTRYVTPRDIRCGETLVVFGRYLQVQDCDEFTRNFYLDHYGITQEKQSTGPPPSPAGHQLPEPEDSMLQPLLVKSERKVSIQKPLGVDQCLRFRAKFASTNDTTQEARRFILSFYLLDSTLAIYEPPVPNSGLSGGKFLDRQNYKLASPLNRYAQASDFVVGGTIRLALTPTQPFELLEADEQTLTYCEDHPDEFSKSNIELVLYHVVKQLKQQASSVRDVFRVYIGDISSSDNKRTISREGFEDVLRHRLNLRLHPQEFITLLRKYSADEIWYDDLCDAVSRVHAIVGGDSVNSGPLDALRRVSVNLRLVMRRVDSSGYISRNLLTKMIAFYGHDIPESMVDSFVGRDGLVDYNFFFDKLYPCDFSKMEHGDEPDRVPQSPRRQPQPTRVPDEGPLYIPTYRSNIDTARFGVIDKAQDVESLSTSMRNSQPFSNEEPSTPLSSRSGPSNANSSPISGNNPLTNRRSLSLAIPTTQPVDPLPFASRFQTTNMRMNSQLNSQVPTPRKVELAERSESGVPSKIELTKEQRAALYKTTAQSMTNNAMSTAALTSERAQAVIDRAKAKLLEETRRNPMIPTEITDISNVDPAACALLTSKFDSMKYQLRQAFRACDREKTGFLYEDQFMTALECMQQNLGENERYLVADALFPSAHAQVNYKQLLDTLFNTAAA